MSLRQRLILTALGMLAAPLAYAGSTVQNVRIWSEDDRTRIVLDLSQPAQHSIFTLRGPDRLVVDLKDSRLADALKNLPTGGSISSIRTGVRSNGQLRVVLDLNQAVRSRSFTAGPNDKYGDRLVIDLQRQGNIRTVKRASEERVAGRDIVIAVDPGHGGHDPGAIGRAKTREKDVALALGKLLAKRINEEPGMKAVLVRSGDYYVDHRERMEIARRQKADLFVSIHADAVDDRRAKGASVYALSLKGASDEASRRLAQRENASDLVGGVSLAGKDPVLASVLLDLSQNAALSASLDVGGEVIRQLARVGQVHKGKVQQAGFLVLKSPDVPSILVETAYISNPDEEKKLRSKSHHNKLAQAILAGISNYFYANPPPNTQLALNHKGGSRQQVNHVISRGDTLSEIAERYDVSMSALRAANKLSSDRVKVGQKLRIPIYAGT
ncbi:MAG: N-acetylmuramoyl-L-alanine amidase [Gammaproteobacteria bacterium]|nr:MAG: N-acetylmuramoyl-L-alanine amidase [Gammaproteobacteria bacterium]